MSKELEAFERIKYEAGTPYFSTLYDIDMWREDLGTVENALKEKEEQDQIIKVIQEIIAFDQKLPAYNIRDNEFDFLGVVAMRIQREIENKERELLRNWVLKTCFPKELEALEIIKNKECLFKGLSETTQEEYELLKEVFL